MRSAIIVSSSVALLSMSTKGATIYLNGGIASLYSVDGSNSGEPGEFDSLLTPNNDIFFNAQTATPFLLPLGNSVFTVTGQGGFNGLGLFFTATNTLVSTFRLAPDLHVFPSGGGFANTAAGIQVATIGQFSGNAPYSGATSFTVDGLTVSVTGWNGNNLSLNVVPEPTAALMLSCGFVLCLGRRIRR